MSNFSAGLWFEVIEPGCGCPPFAMTNERYKYYRKAGRERKECWHCPNCGEERYFSGETQEEKLKRQLEEKQRQLEAESGRAALLAQERNELKKSSKVMRNRIANGVCPCCNRTFQNLMQHMKSEHPDFSKPESLKSAREMFGLTQSALSREIGIQSAYISNYENDKYIPDYAKEMIEDWLEKV